MNIKKDLNAEEIKELKLKSGIEIHQQLEGKKLFCNCPTKLRDDKPDFVVKRYLRVSAGESGIIDAAAEAEIKKQKYYLYQGYEDTTCLVELDEEPPGPVNKEALTASLQTAKLMNMNIVDQVRFMRKIVVNGSNTSGFQRTALIATDGKIETPEGTVRIESLCLEEDASKDVEKATNYTIYNLSRLGIPLIEIATAPDLHTPEMIRDTALQIGMILRSLPNVKRGLGTIRQDVNISIAKGVRVEIKGAQDLKLIPTLAKNEMLRQYNLIEIYEELKKRNAKVETEKDITSLLKNSESKVIQNALKQKDGKIFAAKLEGFAGITGIEIQPGRRYGTELSDHAKTMGVKGLFHSDELPNYGITEEEKQEIFKTLNCNPEKDAFILIADKKEIALRAIKVALNKAGKFYLEKEVRVARPDGSTSYMRPMPGASRMYPETDVKPILPEEIRFEIPKLLTEQIKEWKEKYNLPEDIIKKLLKDHIDLDNLTKKYAQLKPAYIIDFFYGLPALMKKKHNVELEIKKFSEELLSKLNNNEITKESLEEILVKLSRGEQINYADYKPLSIDEISVDVKEIVSSMKEAPRGAIIGKVMAKYKGKVDGKELSQLINKIIGELNGN